MRRFLLPAFRTIEEAVEAAPRKTGKFENRTPLGKQSWLPVCFKPIAKLIIFELPTRGLDKITNVLNIRDSWSCSHRRHLGINTNRGSRGGGLRLPLGAGLDAFVPARPLFSPLGGRPSRNALLARDFEGAALEGGPAILPLHHEAYPPHDDQELYFFFGEGSVRQGNNPRARARWSWGGSRVDQVVSSDSCMSCRGGDGGGSAARSVSKCNQSTPANGEKKQTDSFTKQPM